MTDPADPNPEATARGEEIRRQTRLLGFWGPPLIAAIVCPLMIHVAPTFHADGTCTGIGWGCQPSPKDTAILASIVIVVFGVPLLIAVNWVLSHLEGRASTVAVSLTNAAVAAWCLDGIRGMAA